jgi:hypothetical protein
MGAAWTHVVDSKNGSRAQARSGYSPRNLDQRTSTAPTPHVVQPGVAGCFDNDLARSACACQQPRKSAGSDQLPALAATATEIPEFRTFLQRQHVTTGVKEATGDYWRPFYYALEDAHGHPGQCRNRQ